MVVELDEERLQQLARRLRGQCPFGEPLLVEWQQVLVEVARIEGVPAVEFRDHRQVAEPVVLQGLVKVARGVGGDVPADVGDFLEISLAPWVRLAGGQFGGPLRVALGKHDHRVRRRCPWPGAIRASHSPPGR